jgi:hypothetical protein
METYKFNDPVFGDTILEKKEIGWEITKAGWFGFNHLVLLNLPEEFYYQPLRASFRTWATSFDGYYYLSNRKKVWVNKIETTDIEVVLNIIDNKKQEDDNYKLAENQIVEFDM